jgi:hypothetical protein
MHLNEKDIDGESASDDPEIGVEVKVNLDQLFFGISTNLNL